MHTDLDYFYAQCEEILNPGIRGKPVVVCVYSGRTEESGVVSTCNYEAREYGVRAGIPIVRARKLLKAVQAIFLPTNKPLYEEVSERIMKILRVHGDRYEKAGIDEAYIELSIKANGDFGQAEEIAREIKQQILRQEQLTCSVGIAPNKLLAKIASDHKKPDGLTVMKPEDVNAFLAKLPVSRIPGVGKETEEKLVQMQIATIEQLITVNPTILIEKFGKSLGSYVYRAARGEDDEALEDEDQPMQLSRIGTLKRNTREVDEIKPLLCELASSVTEKLSEKNMTCRSIGIVVVLDDLSIHSKSRTLQPPTSDPEIIRQSSEELMEEFLASKPDLVIRRVGVKVSGLATRSGQSDIFTFL